jgi:tetratricopeptide (TPR) repeat protein
MTKQYPEYDIPKRSIKDRILSQRWSALVIEGLLVLVAVVVTIGFLSPATPVAVEVNQDAIIAELEATIAAQEAALAEATVPTGVLSVSSIKSMAWDNLSNEEYRSAVAMYTVLIQEGEADANTYAARGYAYSRLEEHALAVQDYTQALELNPEMMAIYNNRCWAYSEIGEFDRALNDCNYLMSNVPNADYPYLNRGIVYEHMGSMEAAMSDYMEWINRRGSQVITNENLAWMGNIEVNMNDGYVYLFPFTASTGQDIVISATSVQRDVDADSLLIILDPQGNPLIANDDTGEWWDSYVAFKAPVTGEYTAVLTHAGGSTTGIVKVAYDFSGEITYGNDIAQFKSDGYRALMANDYNAALDSFHKALSLSSQDAEAMNWAGVTYRYMGDYETAIAYITQAMALNSDYNLPYLSRGITFEMMGNSQASAADYLAYTALNSTRNLYHTALNGDSQFELPMREGWVYSVPFDAIQGQTVDIDVSTVAPGFVDPLIMLIGPNNQPLIGDDDIARNDYNATINNFQLPEDGQYTLIITHAEGGANGVINVALDVNSAPMVYENEFGCGQGHGQGR